MQYVGFSEQAITLSTSVGDGSLTAIRDVGNLVALVAYLMSKAESPSTLHSAVSCSLALTRRYRQPPPEPNPGSHSGSSTLALVKQIMGQRRVAPASGLTAGAAALSYTAVMPRGVSLPRGSSITLHSAKYRAP
jgi:hypothetical protein